MYFSNYTKFLDDLVLSLKNLKEKIKSNESKISGNSSSNSTDDDYKKILQIIEINYFSINYKKIHEAVNLTFGLYKKYNQIMSKKAEVEKVKEKE
jgi:hypothetical protein